VVEHLPNKCKALNSNPDTVKRREGEREGGRKEGRNSVENYGMAADMWTPTPQKYVF
jgi:hypothetical protein